MITTASGVVYDQVTMKGIDGATIELTTPTGGAKQYYKTDSNGAFAVPTGGVYGLAFTSPEYNGVTVLSNQIPPGDMSVFMTPKNQTLKEVIVTAGGKRNTWLILGLLAAGYYAHTKKLF